MDTTLSAALGLGFLLGIRHAMDADHVAAVSTLVSQHRSLARSCLLGTFWGLGHTVALLAAGVATIVLRLSISPELERTFETGVGVMLILLGGHVLLRLLCGRSLNTHEHVHGGQSHRHLHPHTGTAHSHHRADPLPIGGRPFLVGLLHGMAGSAALMLLVAAAIPSPFGGLLYILVFGAGSTIGMLVLSGLIGLPFVVTGDWSPRALVIVQVLAGVSSSAIGLRLLWETT
jgi:sulfite exporter TauE/SafE